MTIPLRAALLLGAAFFCSGAASLAFEALWFHQTGLAFGRGVLASALVLSAFMAGMATGNGLAARFGDRLKRPVRVYAALELAVACTGVLLVYVMPGLSSALSPLAVSLESQPVLLAAIRLLAAWLLLLLPSVAMGMTLPLAVRALTVRSHSFGSALGLLYGINTLGAVAGVLTVELALIEPLGIYGSAWVVASLCLAAAGLAALVPGQVAPAGSDAAEPAATSSGSVDAGNYAPMVGALLVACAAISGFAMLGLEVAWLRFLLLFLTDTPLAFAGVLAMVLLGIALGGLLGSAWLARRTHAHAHADAVAYAGAIAGFLGLRGYDFFLAKGFRFEQGIDVVAAIAAPLILGTALSSGLLLTLLGAGLRARQPGDARVTGRLVLANTLGAALGSALTGLWLLPRVGMENCLVGLLCMFGAAGLLLTATKRRVSLPAAGTALATIGLAAAYPYGDIQDRYVHGSVSRWMGDDDKVVRVLEDPTGTLIHVRHGFAGLHQFDQLASNSYSMAVNDFYGRRYMKLYAYLPLALHPGMDSALLVGFGVGNTASALAARPEFSRIDVVDISRGALELSRGMRFVGGRHPLDDERVHVHIEDGRHHLHGTSRRYDLITGEPPPPILAGMSSLYSVEYFHLLRDRLNPGGFVSYWLPLMDITAGTARSIVAAFCQAFEDCTLWHGSARNFMLLGSRDASGGVMLERYVAGWQSRDELSELRDLGFEHPAQLPSLFIGDADYLRKLVENDSPVSDAFPRRMQRPGTKEERDALIWQWRDTKAAERRFAGSAWTKAHFPQRVHQDALKAFENQRLINDLLFPGKTNARNPVVMMQVLAGTPFTMPVLLMMNSDSDIQRNLQDDPSAAEKDPRLLPHVAAGHLAARDVMSALEVLEQVPDSAQPMPGLKEFLRKQAPR
ncbi:MAG: hypothetical protein OXU20_40595 [Myxococcales bacterium]|nr:hypothetical protein [Myxococcales bacterium]